MIPKYLVSSFKLSTSESACSVFAEFLLKICNHIEFQNVDEF